MIRTTTYVEPPFFEYFLPAWYVFWQIHSPSFLLRYLVFFWYHRFNAYTYSLSQKFILLESLVSRFSLLLPVYLLSSPHSLFLYSTHTYISNLSLISTDLRIFPFSDLQKSLTLIAFFETVTFADIVSNFFYVFFLTSYNPFFASCIASSLLFASLLSQLCIIFWRSNTLLAFPCFLCLLIDINLPSLPSNCSLGRACITTHHTTSVHRDN